MCILNLAALVDVKSKFKPGIALVSQ